MPSPSPSRQPADPAQIAQQVRAALSGLTGVLPRRAVVTAAGEVADKRDHPRAIEAPQLSTACEILRRATGDPVFSRHTPALLRQCVNHNQAGAWQALLDDVATGDLDLAAAAQFWAAADAQERGVACLVAAGTGLHQWLVTRALQHVAALLGQAGARHMGLAFQRQFGDLVRTLSRRTRDATADMRTGTMSAVGRLLAWCGIPQDELAGMLDTALRAGHDDVLRLFVCAPVSALAAREPSLVPRLLARAERAQQSSRYPACALLAVLTPEQVRPHEARVMRLVQRVLDTAAAQGSVDAHLALACGVLAKAAAPARTACASLAHALCCMAVSHCAAAAAAAPPPTGGDV